MSDSLVYEITQRMTNSDVVRRDMNDATKLVTGMFQDRYLSQLNKAFESHRKKIEKQPPKEVQLLRAMKAFMPEDKHDMADRTIDMMLLKGTYESIQRELQEGGLSFAPPPKHLTNGKKILAEASVHPDGIYDIDAACIKKQTDGQNKKPEMGFRPEIIFMMMAVMGSR